MSQPPPPGAGPPLPCTGPPGSGAGPPGSGTAAAGGDRRGPPQPGIGFHPPFGRSYAAAALSLAACVALGLVAWVVLGIIYSRTGVGRSQEPDHLGLNALGPVLVAISPALAITVVGYLLCLVISSVVARLHPAWALAMMLIPTVVLPVAGVLSSGAEGPRLHLTGPALGTGLLVLLLTPALAALLVGFCNRRLLLGLAIAEAVALAVTAVLLAR